MISIWQTVGPELGQHVCQVGQCLHQHREEVRRRSWPWIEFHANSHANLDAMWILEPAGESGDGMLWMSCMFVSAAPFEGRCR